MIPFHDPAFLQDPYPILNAVREETSIFRQAKAETGPEVWFLTRHDDVQKALRDRRLGRVFDHVLTYEEAGMQEPDPALQPYLDIERFSLLQLEPPDHTRIRSLLSREFTPRRVAALQPRMREIVTNLLESTSPDGLDVISDLAQPFSLLVICELIGAPFEDQGLLLDWSHRIVKMYELDTTPEQVQSAVEASAEFAAWTKELIAARGADPQDDLISGLCTVETDDGKLTTDEIVSTIILLLNAGHEATVNTLGNGLTALLDHQDQWLRLTDGEVPFSVAVEELFRFDSPLQLFERWVLVDDYEIADTHIPKGDKVAMLFGSANRDPRKWENPDQFDISRGDPTHVAFGWGLHHCIGAPLARLEVASVLEELATRFPNTHLVSQPVRHEAFVIHGYEAVHISLY
jgi:cytochrome P450